MSYLKRPTLVPWQSLEAQFGANYARPRDFRRKTLDQLLNVVRVYTAVRVQQTDTGLRIYPSPPHVLRSKGPTQARGLEGQRLISPPRPLGGAAQG